MIRVFISSGHDSNDPGAVKYVVERDEVWKISNFVAEELNKIKGITAYREDWEDTWKDTVNKANGLNCDYFFEFHENAGRGNGAECIIHNVGNKWMTEEIRQAFLDIGQEWRRVIIDPTFWVLRDTNMPAMIVECAFVDNKEDIEDWDEDSEKRVMAKSLAKHIAKICGVDSKAESEVKPSTKPSKKPAPAKKPTYIYDPNKSLTVKEAIMSGQSEGNKWLHLGIEVDGIVGEQTEKMKALVLQNAMNIDYNACLVLDGIFGTLSKRALGYHTVRFNEIQEMVRALQILLLLNGYNPHGVDGEFGSGTLKAVKDFQADSGLHVDGIAGRNTFLALL